MDDGTKNARKVPKVDDLLTIRLNEESVDRFEKHQIDVFFSRLLSARQDVDQLFRNEFGLTAYPYLEILLLVRTAGDRLVIDDIGDSLGLAPTLSRRHLDILISKGLLERVGSKFQTSRIGEGILTDIIQNHIAYAFKLVD